MSADPESPKSVPWFGARKVARSLMVEIDKTRQERDDLRRHLEKLGALTVIELNHRKVQLKNELQELISRSERERIAGEDQQHALQQQLDSIRRRVVATEEIELLQEAGIYQYRHPLADVLQYESRLIVIESRIKDMVKKDGGAVLSVTAWQVNGSEAQGRAMVRDMSKLMLRAFNAEADNLVRGLKPHRLGAAIERLEKVAETIERLGKIMQIRISPEYRSLRIQELELTADYVQKQAEQKEAERLERERLREERKVEQEMERERLRLEKERKHYENALQKLVEKGDTAAAQRLRSELEKVEDAIRDVDYRAANIRAGYVYVISNIGSFGETMVKVGMTRRLDPLDRIRELSDASVPFNFDVHALFFSKDAVGIETAMHERLSGVRVNIVNRRREFFRATPAEVKVLLAELAGELLEYHEVPEALEYRQCITQAKIAAPKAND
jgi:hypothetical protein